LAGSAPLHILANYNLPLNRALYAQGIMETRIELSAKIKRRQLLHRIWWLLVFSFAFSYISYLVVDYVQAPSTSVEIHTKWYECKGFQCTYKVEIRNTSKSGSKGYLRLNGLMMMSNAIKSNVTHQFYTEKIKFELGGFQKKTIRGSIKIKDNSSLRNNMTLATQYH
jgi:hypothetical protein